MKLNHHKFAFTFLLFLSWVISSYGFDVPVHDEITAAAVNGSSGLANYLRDNNIDPLMEYSGIFENLPNIGLNVEALIRLGSINEDYNGVDEGGDRSVNHFYDPTTKQGLSIPVLRALGITGLPSETWGTISNAVNHASIVGGFNQYAWQNARAYQSNSIATSGPAQNRNLQAALMFRSLGQVIHLLQDAAQPQHARNEQHLDRIGFFNTPWRSAFEDWGKKNINLITFTPQDFDWMAAGFTCVSNFWDTGQYNPNATGTTPLDENENGTITLGMAEYCNGNFLTVRGVYGDLTWAVPVSAWSGTSTDYYPISTSTDLQQVEANPSAYATSTYLTGSWLVPQTVYRCYVDKTSQGAHVSPHSALDLIPTLSQSSWVQNVHVDDPDVMSNYYAILIPKAIAYSAGLLDYYFRGRLAITECTLSNQTCYFTAENICLQDMDGGAFRMFTDDISSNRTEAPDLVTSYATNKTLPPGGTITGSFTVTNCFDPDFVLAYFGPIGVGAGGQPLDTVDSNSCASIQFPNPSPCSVTTRIVSASSDDATNGAGEDAWFSAYTFSNQPWGTWVFAEFHDGNDAAPYYLNTNTDLEILWSGAIVSVVENGFYVSGTTPILDGGMSRAQFYLPAPIGWSLIAVGENPTLDPNWCVLYGCTYPQQPANEYPMIVDPGFPDWNSTVDGYHPFAYYFGLAGNGLPNPQFPFPQFPDLSAATAYFNFPLGPSFNPNSVCTSPTNFP